MAPRNTRAGRAGGLSPDIYYRDDDWRIIRVDIDLSDSPPGNQAYGAPEPEPMAPKYNAAISDNVVPQLDNTVVERPR